MEGGKHIRVLTIKYTTSIQHHEIPLFRGAVIDAMGSQVDVLFHNHINDQKLRYAYPLIQYKRIGGKAAIVCIGIGTEIIGQFLAIDNKELLLGEKKLTFEIDSITPRQLLVQTWQSNFTYFLNRWLPLNSDNYQTYLQCESLVEKIQVLEKILIGNIISFAKGMEIEITEQLVVKICDFKEPYIVKCKHTALMAFDIEFISNMSIPENIGLGKHASLGFGMVNMKKNRNTIKKNNYGTTK